MNQPREYYPPNSEPMDEAQYDEHLATAKQRLSQGLSAWVRRNNDDHGQVHDLYDPAQGGLVGFVDGHQLTTGDYQPYVRDQDGESFVRLGERCLTMFEAAERVQEAACA